MVQDSSVGTVTCYKLDGLGIEYQPISVAELSKATVCSRSLTWVAGSNPVWGMDVCVVCVVQ